MLSRKRAELRANGLLKAARVEREHAAARGTRFLVFLYPALSGCAPSKRWSSVQRARERAGRKKHVAVANMAFLLPTIASIIAWVIESDALSVCLWIAVGTVNGAQILHFVQTRTELRAILESPFNHARSS